MTSETEYRELAFAPGYRIGDDGSVWSKKNARWGMRKTWKRLVPSDDSSGYPSLALMIEGRRRGFRINVLVLLAFHGPRPARMDSCHDNGLRSDCRLSNLRWDTRRANMLDGIRHGRVRVGSRSNLAKLNEEQVAAIRDSGQTGRALARFYEVSEGSISMIRNRKSWKHTP